VDDSAVIWLNEVARHERRVAAMVGFVAERMAVVEVALMLLLGVAGRRRTAVRMLTAVGVVYVASEVLGRLWPRPRPFERLAEVEDLAQHAAGRSFPSRHVASGLAMAVVGAQEHPRLGVLMAGVAWLLGLSRVAAGLHYPSDVLAGAVLGTAVARYVRNV
jgi:undecaprenyl-diphosphatase